ncbi:WD repeat-containing [Botrytis cinerea]
MLNNSWGLQVSICTGVARRIPLRELLAEVIPKFIKMKPLVSRDKEMWKVLTRKHHIIKALKGTGMKDLKEWQIELKDEKLENLVIRMIRSVLSALERTGVVEDGKKKLRIAWIVESDILRCFEIPCEGKYAWTQILKDSPYCATFAYYTTKCFSTGHIDCCKIHLPGSGWKCAFPTLETAVWYHDKNVRENLNSEPLEHNKCYLIGESKLTARFEKRNGERMPTLFIRSLSTKVDPRYWLGKKRRIRERQLYNSLFAENVMVEAVN